MSAYRDPAAHLLASVEAKLAAIAASLSALSPLDRVRLPPPVRERIANLPTSDEFGADVESLTRAHDELHALLVVIDAARSSHAMVPPLRVWKSLGSSSVWMGSEVVRSRFLTSLTERIRAVDPQAEAPAADGNLRCLAPFHHGDMPVLASASLSIVNSNNRFYVDYEVSLMTTIVPDIPRLRVSPEGALEALGSALGLIQDLEFDDELFDSSFLVQGDVDVARLVLADAGLRRGLVMLAHLGPNLHVEPTGLLTVRWHGSDPVLDMPSQCLPDPALLVLADARRALTRD